jgi:hypothetical protein
VPQLRGQFCAAPGAAAASACEQPTIDAARFQPGRLRPLSMIPKSGHRFSEKIMLKQQAKVKQ